MSSANGDVEGQSRRDVVSDPLEERPHSPPAHASLPPSEPDNRENDAKEDSDGDEDDTNNSDDSDDEPVESLLQGRERRSNQANRYASLLQQETIDEDGNDEFNDIFREGGDEDTDFEDSDAADVSQAEEDDDSSSDDDDQGPAAAAGDLEGEKELRQEERAAKRVEKRKADRVLTKIPTVRKRVKIDESATPDSTRPGAGAMAERKRKMSERISWMPAGLPARTSSRTLSVKNKERTMASMKQSEQKRLKQIAIMEAAQKRKEETKAPPMTQEERLAEAARTEELNSKSLSRWEEMEEEKARKQAARLEAMHNRKIEGPFVRWYSAKAEWADGTLTSYGKSPVTEIVHIHEEEEQEPEKRPGRKPKAAQTNAPDTNGQADAQVVEQEGKTPPPTGENSSVASPVRENPLEDYRQGLLSVNKQTDNQPEQSVPQDEQPPRDQTSTSNSVQDSMQLDNEETSATIDAYKSNDDQATSQNNTKPTEIRAASANDSRPASVIVDPSSEPPPIKFKAETPPNDTQIDNGTEAVVEENTAQDDQETAAEGTAAEESTAEETAAEEPAAQGTAAEKTAVEETTTEEPATEEPAAEEPTVEEPAAEATVTQDDLKTSADATTPEENSYEEPEPPAVIEHTTRNVITLENYDETSINDPIIRRTIVFGTPLPKNFAPSGSMNKRSLLPAKAAPPVCCITRQPAKYRDPVSGLPYASLSAYKAIQKVIKGHAVWSDLIGAWVGGDEKAANGGAAKGVPEGFFSGVLPEKDETVPGQGSTEADAAIKSETVA